MTTDIEIKFMYRETEKDSYNDVKTVEITTRSTEGDEILAAFIEFGQSIGLTIDAKYIAESATAH